MQCYHGNIWFHLSLTFLKSRANQCVLVTEKFLKLSAGAQYATGDQWRNNSRKNERMEPKQKKYTAVDGMVIEARSDAVKSSIA